MTESLPHPTVAIRRCPDYELSTARDAIRSAIELVPGAGDCFKPGATVLLKPNVVTPRGPDRPVCTHPAIVRAVAEVAHEAGCEIIVADQPTYAFAHRPDEVLKPTGYGEALEGIPATLTLLNRDGYEPIDVANPLQLQTTHVARLQRDVDVVINLAKCKTHAQTTMTMALKNMFGGIAPRDRLKIHALGTYVALSESLADCFSVAVPELSIIDAVTAMQGFGPTRGTPKHVGAVAVSTNAVALDLAVEEMVGAGGQVELTKAAARLGLGPGDIARVDVVGDDPEDLRTQLRLPPKIGRSFPPIFGHIGEKLIYVRPRVSRRDCISCGGCADACPVDAITISDVAHVDRGKCVECFCCMEACPVDAINAQRSPLSYLFG